MALYFNPGPEAQRAIIKTMRLISENHSTQSQSSLKDKLSYLDDYGDEGVDVVITHAGTLGDNSIEFGLLWTQVPKDERDVPRGRHPIGNDRFMNGGLVYHDHSDSWGVHT